MIVLMIILLITSRSFAYTSKSASRWAKGPLYAIGATESSRNYRTRKSMDENADTTPAYHVPVLLQECCEYLNIQKDCLYVDCTLGGGGHTREILARGGRVIGLDQDPDAIAKTSNDLKEFITSDRLEIIQTNFRYVESAIKSSRLANGSLVDGVLMDLGISSHQIDEPSRGFAFGADGPLDMRMGQGSTEGGTGLTAAKIINDWDVTAIADVLYNFGDETRSRQIAREIVAARPVNTTGELEKIISGVTFWKHRSKTLARCFQALRIVVNDELAVLDQALMSVQNTVRPGGRLVIMSYHSLEDRRVKRLLKTGSVYEDEEPTIVPWIPLFKGAQAPSDEEIERNRRARSAKLRVAERADKAGTAVTVAADANKYNKKRIPTLGAKELARLERRRQEEEEAKLNRE